MSRGSVRSCRAFDSQLPLSRSARLCRSRLRGSILRNASCWRLTQTPYNIDVRILLAPDKFKSTLNAREVAKNITRGLLDVLSDAQIEMVPMADGGEGTAGAVCDARA